MPELPDLEVFKQNLLDKVIGKTITETSSNTPKSLVGGTLDQLKSITEGHSFTDISRRGKHLLFHLSNDSVLILHLMLRGRLAYGSEKMGDDFKDCFGFTFDDGDTLRVTDPTRWIKLEIIADGNLEDSKLLNGLGPEADDITLDELTAKLKRSRIGRIKPLLQDQKKLAGLGNAYIDEILWKSKIHPNKTASMLNDEEVKTLHSNINAVLKWGIDESKKDVRDKLEESTRKWMNVYRKEGKPCPECNTTIEHSKVNQRDTFTCPKCQSS